jgi:hypothetical protein
LVERPHKHPCSCFDCTLWQNRYSDRIEGRRDAIEAIVKAWENAPPSSSKLMVVWVERLNPETLE